MKNNLKITLWPLETVLPSPRAKSGKSLFTWLKECACPPLEARKPADEVAPLKYRIILRTISIQHETLSPKKRFHLLVLKSFTSEQPVPVLPTHLLCHEPELKFENFSSSTLCTFAIKMSLTNGMKLV